MQLTEAPATEEEGSVRNEAQGTGTPTVEEYERVAWLRLRECLTIHGLVRNQRESFDHFMATMLPYIISENSDVWSTHSGGMTRHSIRFENVRIMRPSVKEFDGFERQITPSDARMRGLTYSSNVLVRVVHDTIDTSTDTPKVTNRSEYANILLCRIPVMVNSSFCHLNTNGNGRNKECAYDEGGYFIINGIEKALMAQEKLRTNYPYVFEAKKGLKSMCYVCEVRSCHETKMRSTSTLYINASHKSGGASADFSISLPFIETGVPIAWIFKVLGVPQTDIIPMILGDKSDASTQLVQLVMTIVDNSTNTMSMEDIVEWIGREGTRETTRERRQKYVEHILCSELLPHIGLERTPQIDRRKSIFLGIMIKKLCMVFLGMKRPDDRDHYKNKRIDTAGVLMSLLFRQLYRNFLKSLTIQVHKMVENGKIGVMNLSDVVSDKKITSGFKYAFSTGNWGIQKTSANQTGVAQMLSRMTTVSALANLRRINTPINREGKSPKPRQLHFTSYGIVCPAETPEGAGCGLVKNLALLCHVRVGYYSETIDAVLKGIPFALRDVDRASVSNISKDAIMFVNGRIIGYVNEHDVDEIVKLLRSMKRSGDLPFDCSIYYEVDYKFLHVCTDPGALCRPVIPIENLHMFMDERKGWNSLLSCGAIEYIDKAEEETTHVSISYDAIRDYHAYVDIHPSMMNGLPAGLIPFPDHNQAPRNTYQSAMGKQAIGCYTTNYMQRIDTVAHVLLYPQKPLVMTRVDDILGVSNVPAGQNTIVAIMTYTGFNQEDSVIINQRALDRGLFRSMLLRSYKDEENSTGVDSERFGPLPSDCIGMRAGCYAKLNESGFVSPGERVNIGDAIIGKIVCTSDVENNKRTIKRDRSTLVKHNEEQTVDVVYTTRNKDGHLFVRIRTRSLRVPQIGDKVSSRHGQKGVIGMVLPQEDMPFTKDGVCPDVIINPHAIPSRMTIGQLLETLLGKLCTVTGNIGDGTPFRGASVEQVADELEKLGYDRYSREKLTNGMTGEEMDGQVFIGPVTYQRLKHMVEDKRHARSRGPVQILTRQPVEGRAREGGLRFGEMERDCVISHGAAHNLRERLFEQSDPFTCSVCVGCGFLATPKSQNTIVKGTSVFCNICETGEHVREIRIPYAFKLLIHELMSLNIGARLRIKKNEKVVQDNETDMRRQTSEKHAASVTALPHDEEARSEFV